MDKYYHLYFLIRHCFRNTVSADGVSFKVSKGKTGIRKSVIEGGGSNMMGSQNKSKNAGLYILGSLYPYATGGMEIFNYYFLNHQLKNPDNTIFYLGENKTDLATGHFVPLQRLRPQRFFYPFQFFFTVLKLRKKLDFVYLCFAEQSWIIPFAHSLALRFFNIPYIVTIHWGKA